MTKYVAVAAAFLAVLGWALWLRADVTALRAENTMLDAALASERAYRSVAEEANRVHRARIKRLEEDAATWDKLTRELLEMDGSDEPLSDYLRDAAKRLWP